MEPQQSSVPLTLFEDSTEIMKKLERAPSTLDIEGSYTRLNQHLFTPAMQDVFERIRQEYSYWDKVKYLPMPKGVLAKDVWTIVKIGRRTTAHWLHFGEYRFQWNVNSRMQELLHLLDMNIGGTLGSSTIDTRGDRQRYVISSMMEEAIASSQIEGAVTTRRIAKEMLRRGRKPANKSEQMIVNNWLTIQEILLIKDEPLTHDRLLHIHRLVTARTMVNPDEEGAFRTDDEVRVHDSATGAIVHQPPLAKELARMMDDLFRFFNEDDPKLFIHPIVKASIVHFMLGFIHPFADGNGRTARALFYWYLLKRGYWLTEYLSISRLILRAKAQYAMAFQYTETDENDLTYFVLFNLEKMRGAFEELREYIRRKADEKKQASHFLALDGVNHRQAQILEWFYHEPDLLLTIREAQERLGVSHQNARIHLTGLARTGYLEETALDGRTKGFQKSAGFDELVEKVR